MSQKSIYSESITYDYDDFGEIILRDLNPTNKYLYPATILFNEKGIFLEGQTYDAFKAISDLIKQATSSIDIIDTYVGEQTFDLLAHGQSDILIRILTKHPHRQNDLSRLKSAYKAYKKQYNNKVSLRFSDAFHDRFLIIDNSIFYHFGSSIKDAGKSAFMFSKIEERVLVDLLHNEFLRAWESATEIEKIEHP